MKYTLIALAVLAFMASSHAQSRIYRCGNTYTNDAAQAQAQGCKLMEGGNITVVEGTRVNASANASANAAPGAAVRVAAVTPSVSANVGTSAQRVDSADQRSRDSDARLILEAELRKAETRQAELLKEFNNGEPEKLGAEHRNHQKYLDRVADLKASIARNDNDIAGLRRELSRVAASK